MLIRFISKNIFSFKEETEFNLFTNKTTRLKHHKIETEDFDFLRFSAIYGANGAGKSNLIKSISLLQSLVNRGKVSNFIARNKFQLDKENTSSPISLGIEILIANKVYYYTISFDNNLILNEYLAESHKDSDELIFERNNEGSDQIINFHEKYVKTPKEKLFLELLAEKLIQKDELLLTFLSNKYEKEFTIVKAIKNWFENTLIIVSPDSVLEGVVHLFDKESKIKEFANDFIKSLNTGITKIEIKKENFDLFFGKVENVEMDIITELKNKIHEDPNNISTLAHSETGEQLSVVVENNEIMTKKLIFSHLNSDGEEVCLNLEQESDGTKRLIDYIPFLNGIINDSSVVIIDEIERSIHPNTIKEIITKLSLDENIKGQLIFTTHDSNLLDQKILRPDEIWFAQKDSNGSTRLYSLSDFKIHNTIDIENGYLNGRYGGVPFLSNLKELNW